MQVWTHTHQSAPVPRYSSLLLSLSLTRRSFLRLGKACAFKRRIGQRFCTNIHSWLMIMKELANLQLLVHLILFNEWIRGFFSVFNCVVECMGRNLHKLDFYFVVEWTLLCSSYICLRVGLRCCLFFSFFFVFVSFQCVNPVHSWQ
jgi:hypothetical protein